MDQEQEIINKLRKLKLLTQCETTGMDYLMSPTYVAVGALLAASDFMLGTAFMEDEVFRNLSELSTEDMEDILQNFPESDRRLLFAYGKKSKLPHTSFLLISSNGIGFAQDSSCSFFKWEDIWKIAGYKDENIMLTTWNNKQYKWKVQGTLSLSNDKYPCQTIANQISEVITLTQKHQRQRYQYYTSRAQSSNRVILQTAQKDKIDFLFSQQILDAFIGFYDLCEQYTATRQLPATINEWERFAHSLKQNKNVSDKVKEWQHLAVQDRALEPIVLILRGCLAKTIEYNELRFKIFTRVKREVPSFWEFFSTQYNQHFLQQPYAERKLLLLGESLPKLLPEKICLFTKDNYPADLRFPVGHPLVGQLYIGHPLQPNYYIPIDDYQLEFLDDKLRELFRVMQALGAVKCTSKVLQCSRTTDQMFQSNEVKADITSTDGNLTLQGGLSNTNTTYKKIRTRFSREQKYKPIKNQTSYTIPEDVIWYPHESKWQTVAKQRNMGGLEYYTETVEMKKTNFFKQQEEEGLQLIFTDFEAVYGVGWHRKVERSVFTDWQLKIEFSCEFKKSSVLKNFFLDFWGKN